MPIKAQHGLIVKLHMPVQFKVRLFAVNAKGFDGSDGRVEYNENIFLNEDEKLGRSVITVNSKVDHSVHLDKDGVLTLEIDPSGKKKPRLVSFEV